MTHMNDVSSRSHAILKLIVEKSILAPPNFETISEENTRRLKVKDLTFDRYRRFKGTRNLENGESWEVESCRFGRLRKGPCHRCDREKIGRE